jgi:hypothetical protein
MGVSLTWKPENPNKGEYFASGSRIHDALERAFGSPPFTLHSSDISVLYGIKACGFEEVQEIIDAIEKHDAVVIDASW